MNKNRKTLNKTWLVKALNLLKDAEFGEEKAWPITIEQINKYCNPSNLEVRRYRTFNIPKKNGKMRVISAPHKTLNNILHFLNILLTNIYEPNGSAMGFVPGRSVVDNAKMHVGHNYVFNLDLKDFFTSINEARVVARLQCPPFNFNRKLALTIGGLCAIRTICENGDVVFVLPQGAPTSPLLSNAISDNLDRRLRGLAKKYGLHYSRYADDITFSSMRNVYRKDGQFWQDVQSVISDEGFTINETKTRLQKKNRRQEVTGLTVNSKPNVARQYIHDLRCILHIWRQYGYEDAYSRFYPKYKAEKGHVKKGEPILENVIEGKLNYLRMVKGEDDAVYVKLLERYSSLHTHIYHDKETDRSDKFIAVLSYKVSDFEHRLDTKIELIINDDNKISANCVLFGEEKAFSISKKTQDWLIIDGKKNIVNGITKLENPFLSSCYIALYRKKRENFWLLTNEMPDMNAPKKLNQKEIPLEDLINLWREKGLDEASKYFDLFTKRKIKVIPKDSQEDTEHDITTLTPEQIKRTFIWLKKRGYTDQEAHDLLKEKFADDLIRHIVKSKTDKVDKPEQVFDITVLTPEEIDWAINMMKSKGWSEQECNSIIKQKYAEILLYRFLADRIRNKEKEENIQIPKQIELVMNHIKTNGWSDEMAHITINYLYENNKLKSN